VTEVAREVDDPDPPVVLGEILQDRQGAVAGAVVDIHQLEVEVGAFAERRGQLGVERLDAVFLVVDREDVRDEGAAHGLLPRRRQLRRDDIGYARSNVLLGHSEKLWKVCELPSNWPWPEAVRTLNRWA
jgi:hypothetical protein